MTEAFIRLERRNCIATVTIDGPQRINAIDAAMTRQLTGIFEEIARDGDVRVVALRSTGKHFSSGGDLDAITGLLDNDPSKRSAIMRDGVENLSKPLALALDAVPQPVIACVRGHVIGLGLQLVAMSDLVVASETARFTFPQLQLGHTPDHGESWSLVRRVGVSRALEMLLTGYPVEAKKAESFGLVNWVVPDGDLDAFAEALTGRVAANPPLAARMAKALIRSTCRGSLEQALDAEIDAAASAAATEDFVEAISAFMAKRVPNFTGR